VGGGLYTSQGDPLWPENQFMLTFGKFKLNPRTGQKLFLNPVQLHLIYLALSVGLLTFSWIGTLFKAWHTSLSINEGLQDLGKVGPMRNKQQKECLLHAIG